MGNANKEYHDRFIRKHKQLFAQAKERHAQQLAEQQEAQSVQEKLQQLLAMADLKAQIAMFQNTDNSITTIKSANADNANALSADVERYKQTIATKMVALIKQRKIK
ncbi:hypothetical protein D3C73_1281040 [compost metagenome]